MIYCSVKDCKNNSSLKNLHFFSYPKVQIICDQWIAFTKRVDWTPKPNSKMCSDHFAPHLIDGQHQLREGAVPISQSGDAVKAIVEIGKYFYL